MEPVCGCRNRFPWQKARARALPVRSMPAQRHSAALRRSWGSCSGSARGGREEEEELVELDSRESMTSLAKLTEMAEPLRAEERRQSVRSDLDLLRNSGGGDEEEEEDEDEEEEDDDDDSESRHAITRSVARAFPAREHAERMLEAYLSFSLLDASLPWLSIWSSWEIAHCTAESQPRSADRSRHAAKNDVGFPNVRSSPPRRLVD